MDKNTADRLLRIVRSLQIHVNNAPCIPNPDGSESCRIQVSDFLMITSLEDLADEIILASQTPEEREEWLAEEEAEALREEQNAVYYRGLGL